MCDNLPTEILEQIFVQLLPKNLCICRVVCLKWKQIVDYLTRDINLWRKHCRRDYPDIFDVAYKKSRPGLSWYFLYRSLTLWPKVQNSRITQCEFAVVEEDDDYIIDFYVLSDGVVGVHKKECIVYYDLHTLRKSQRDKIVGTFLFYRENDNIIITVDSDHSLLITWKGIDYPKSESTVTLKEVKSFFLLDNIIYCVIVNDEICSCTMVNGTLVKTSLVISDYSVASLGCRHGEIYILTINKTIFKLQNKKLIAVTDLNVMTFIEMFNELRKYDFQREVVFSFCVTFYAEVTYFNDITCLLPICDNTILYSYGHIVFSGSELGNFHIYHAPDGNNLLNIKELYNNIVTESYNLFPTPICAIKQIHVVESYNSHLVLISTSNKITVMKFIH